MINTDPREAQMTAIVREYFATSPRVAAAVAAKLDREGYEPSQIARNIGKGGVTHDYVHRLVNEAEDGDE